MKSKTIILLLGVVSIFALIFMGFSKTKKIETDKESLLFMFEEEKLARDTYTYFFEKYGTRQFENIKESEQTHMNAVAEILKNNKISYQELEKGKFANANLQNLYNQLITQGNQSEIEALKAGSAIEDVDIYDLQRLKKETKSEEIIKVYNFLECASRNHMRAFNRVLTNRNSSYVPQYISKEAYNEIINGDHEMCGEILGKNCQ